MACSQSRMRRFFLRGYDTQVLVLNRGWKWKDSFQGFSKHDVASRSNKDTVRMENDHDDGPEQTNHTLGI